MNAIATAFAPSLRCYLLEARCEFVRLLRTPSFAVPTLLFPSLFYLLFGVLLGGTRGPQAATWLLAGYGVFGVMAPGLFGFGVAIALDRERGLLQLKRALPAPPAATLVARLAMAMLFATVIALQVLVLGLTLGGVAVTLPQALMLVLVDVLGVLPFCALGLWIGSVVGGQGAPAVVNLVYLPMAFLSGLWIPLKFLPGFIAVLAPAWPSYHLAQLALKVLGQDAGGSAWGHVAVLAAVTLVFFALARRRLARA